MHDSTYSEWDAAAGAFDDAPDHGLRDPGVRAAWRDLLIPFLPAPPGRVADIACGTGSLSLLLSDEGYEVVGVDSSARMLERALAKTRGAANVTLVRGDAEHPRLEPASFDAVLARHVLFLFDDRTSVVKEWARLVRPGGRLVLIEGWWSTGAGMSAAQCLAAVEPHVARLDVIEIGGRSQLWGGPVDDERYVVVADV